MDAGVDGTVVWVSNGTYISTAAISLTKGVKLRSLNGRESTILKVNNGTQTRTVYISHPLAVVDGFTMIRVGANGGGVQIYHYGLLMNSTLTNAYWVNIPGGSVQMMGGTVSNCTIIGGVERTNGGLQMEGEGALAVNCVITNNSNNSYVSETCVGGVYVAAGCTLRNSLVAYNRTIGWSGGIYNLGTVENCTVVSNTTSSADANACGGVRGKAGLIRNSIIVDNQNTGGGTATNWTRAAGVIEYTCTEPSVDAYGSGNITDDPLFRNSGPTPFALSVGSPCINPSSPVGRLLRL